MRWPWRPRGAPPPDPTDVPALCAALADPDAGVQQRARAALVAAREKDALVSVFRESSSASARALALRALVELGPGDLAELLSEGLRDPDLAVRRVAGDSGGRPLTEESPDVALRRSAMWALAQNPLAQDRDALLRALGDADEEVRAAAADGLRRWPEAAPALVGALADPGASVRAMAVRSLCDLKAEIPAIIAALQDSDAAVRAQAAAGLGDLGDPTAVLPLLAALERGEALAARALGQLGDLRALAPLVAALGRRELAGLAAEGLGELGDRAAIPALEGLLRRWRRDPHLRPDDPDAADLAALALQKLRGSAR